MGLESVSDQDTRGYGSDTVRRMHRPDSGRSGRPERSWRRAPKLFSGRL